jgi:outer membrane lipoprotein-sorting protein
MKKHTLSLAVVIFLSTAFASAQNLDEVLENYFEVLGQETILASNSSMSTGKMLQSGLEIPFIQYASAPNNFRIEATFQEMTLIQTFNGKEGWSLNPFAGMTDPQEMSEDELKSTKNQADYEGLLWNWKEKGYKVSLEDNEEVEGVDCYTIKVISEDEDVYTYFIDSESYVTIKMNAKVTMQGQVTESDTFMSNYQEGDGFIYPAKVETKMNGQVISTIVIDKTVLNVELKDGMFDKPSK